MFKALLQHQAQLGIKMMDVQTSILKGPLSDSDLQTAACMAITCSMQRQGWFVLQGSPSGVLQLFSTNPLEAAQGQPCNFQSVKLSANVRLPTTVIVHVSVGMSHSLCTLTHYMSDR